LPFWRKKHAPPDAETPEPAPAHEVPAAESPYAEPSEAEWLAAEAAEPAGPTAVAAPGSAEAAETAAPAIPPDPAPLPSWSERLSGGPIFRPQPDELDVEPPDLADRLEKSRFGFMSRLRTALGTDGDGGPSWDDVEETLIAGDVGAALAMDIVERARRRREPGGAEAAVRAELAALLAPRNGTWAPQRTATGPAVILVVGVNGTGKTTTIGKLAARYSRDGQSIILAAADTFRAAAIDQLRIWADRAGVPVVAHAPGADPGAVVFDALDAAVARGTDVVIADTAGRLHTKSNLMDELAKVRRIIDKRLPGVVPETLFVLDATTGQNGLAQARAFHEAVGLTGIVLTKLDSTAKGGIVFAIEDALKVPVRFVGVGEKAGDLLPFDPDAFVGALFA
jgi:fused signal recognition particle receptor